MSDPVLSKIDLTSHKLIRVLTIGVHIVAGLCMHRDGSEASLFVVFGRVRRGEHLAAPSARRRPQIPAAGPRVGAVHVPAVLGHVFDRLPVALGALQPLRAVLFLDVNLEVVPARKQLLALSALQEIALLYRGFVL